MIRHQFPLIALLFAATALVPVAVPAQRFEGIITIRFDGSATGVASRGQRATVGGDAERGTAARGEARGNAARGNAARGNAASGRGNAGANDAADAMRRALSGGVQQIEYMTRRGKVRIALGGNGGPPLAAMLYVPDEGMVYTLLPGLSMYAEMPLADAQALSETASAGGTSAAPTPPKVTHTKQFELIAGYRCEHVLFTSGTEKTDICMAKGLGVFVMPAMAGAAAGWDKVLVAEDGFPLKVVQPSGSVLMEVVRIERKALGEALFSVPDAYSRMPDLMRRPPG